MEGICAMANLFLRQFELNRIDFFLPEHQSEIMTFGLNEIVFPCSSPEVSVLLVFSQ